MERKEVSVQANLDSGSISPSPRFKSHSRSTKRTALSEKSLKIKNVHVEKMRIQKIMTFSLGKKKYSQMTGRFKSNLLERLKIDVNNGEKCKKQEIQLSCQGRHLHVKTKEEKSDIWVKNRWPGECSTERNKNIGLRTVNLLDGKKEFKSFKDFRESKVLSSHMLKKIGHLKVKYEVFKCFK
jgi:hypothetical protein